MTIRSELETILSGVCPDCASELREWEIPLFAGRRFTCLGCDKDWGTTSTALASEMYGEELVRA